PFRATRLVSPLEDARVDTLLEAARRTDERLPLLVRLAWAGATLAETGRSAAVDDEDRVSDAGEPPTDGGDLVAAVIGWAVPFLDLDTFVAAVRARRERLIALRRDDARLTLATVHSTKGLEFDHVTVVGMDAGRFPSARSIADAADPARQLEEERRLAYVAWTRARRSLTLSYDPADPSPFLLEAFSPEELGLRETAVRAPAPPPEPRAASRSGRRAPSR
ncbi:MAG TPA: 3'-5' exonuclease, partial [Candidatus Binatia bacterium]|nr:3'-5' exonuclease [Candidatus Binatia bacterium]